MPLVALQDLTVVTQSDSGPLRILNPINFQIQHGEAVGLVGESGSGKTLTWLAALGLLPSTMRVGGQAFLDGRNIVGLDDKALSEVRGRRIAMIFQDPASALNPVLSIGRQISETLALHRGLTGAAIKSEATRLLDAVGIAEVPHRLRQYPHELSGGMNQRVMIAMALAGAPDLLIADEPTTALDVTIQAQILDLLNSLRRETGMALIFISHDLGVVAEVSDRIAVMLSGQIVEDAPTPRIFEAPAHPYTRELLTAYRADVPPRHTANAAISRSQHASRCAFLPGCAEAHSDCATKAPSLQPIGHLRRSPCLRNVTSPVAIAGEAR